MRIRTEYTPEQREALLAQVPIGATHSVIIAKAKELGVNPSTLRAWVTRYRKTPTNTYTMPKYLTVGSQATVVECFDGHGHSGQSGVIKSVGKRSGRVTILLKSGETCTATKVKPVEDKPKQARPHHSNQFKRYILDMLDANPSLVITDLSQRIGVSSSTISAWRRLARENPHVFPAYTSNMAERWQKQYFPQPKEESKPDPLASVQDDVLVEELSRNYTMTEGNITADVGLMLADEKLRLKLKVDDYTYISTTLTLNNTQSVAKLLMSAALLYERLKGGEA